MDDVTKPHHPNAVLTPRVVPFAVERPALENDLRRDQTGVKMLTVAKCRPRHRQEGGP